MKEIILSPTESLADALAKVRPHTRLVLAPRVYREKVEICTPDIELAGSADRTRIVYGDYARTGTQVEGRYGFKKLMRRAEGGTIDYILSKSISILTLSLPIEQSEKS